MAFEQFPYTNLHDLNLDWILAKVKDFNTRLDTIKQGILEEANANTNAQINALRSKYEADIASLRSDVRAFQQTVNSNLTLFQAQIDNIADAVEANAAAQRYYTDTAIAQNNTKLLDDLTENVSTLLVVLNPFTGETIPLQEMIQYLSNFHMENAITYEELAQRNKTYTQIGALNITYTQLAINGKILIQ